MTTVETRYSLTYQNKMHMWLDQLNERLWERLRSKETQLPLRTAFRYWLLNCDLPW